MRMSVLTAAYFFLVGFAAICVTHTVAGKYVSKLSF